MISITAAQEDLIILAFDRLVCSSEYDIETKCESSQVYTYGLGTHYIDLRASSGQARKILARGDHGSSLTGGEFLCTYRRQYISFTLQELHNYVPQI